MGGDTIQPFVFRSIGIQSSCSISWRLLRLSGRSESCVSHVLYDSIHLRELARSTYGFFAVPRHGDSRRPSATNLNLYKSTARMLSLVERRRFWMLAFACCTMMLIRVSRQWFTSRRHSHTHTHNFKQIVRSRLDAHTLPPFKLFCCGLCNERSLQMVSRAFTILLNYSIPIYLN